MWLFCEEREVSVCLNRRLGRHEAARFTHECVQFSVPLRRSHDRTMATLHISTTFLFLHLVLNHRSKKKPASHVCHLVARYDIFIAR